MKTNRFFRFLLTLLFLTIPFFVGHYLVSNTSWKNELILTYGFNVLLGIIFLLIFLWKEKILKPYLGYYFLYFSLFKFVVFLSLIQPLLVSLFKFVVFLSLIQPLLDRSGGVKGHAFLSFFIPYALCLVLEIRFVIRELNTSD
jgi:hypothetical protein